MSPEFPKSMSFLKNLFGNFGKGPANSDEVSRRRQQAAIEELRILDQHFPTTFESHPASVLRAAAWLAGTSLFRSFNLTHSVAPGSVILSDKANDEGTKLLNLYLYTVISRNHINLDPKKMIMEIPLEYKPRKDILTVQELFQDPYNQIMRKHGFDYSEGAQVGVLACGII